MQYLYLTGYVIVLVLMQYLSDADQSCSEHVGMLRTTVWGEKETILLLPTQVYIAFRRLQTIKQNRKMKRLNVVVIIWYFSWALLYIVKYFVLHKFVIYSF